MEIIFWQSGDDKLMEATLKSILGQMENPDGTGEISNNEALEYYSKTIANNSRADFVIEAFKPLENRLLKVFSKETIIKAIGNE